MIPRRNLHWLPAVLALALLAALWLALAPIQLGGRAAFVIVNGNSMEPLYHRGDLVIAQAAADYRIGDIVTYRHPQIGPVIHRIVGRDGERWIFKGDHNDFIDPYRPVQADLVGRSWVYLPSVGWAIERLRSPVAAALLALGIGVLMMGTTIRGSKRRGSPKRGPRVADRAGGYRESLLGVLALLALGSLVLAGFAFARPSEREVTDNITYQQSGEFNYSAAAPDGLYDAPGARTGDPVFRRMSAAMSVDFAYRFEGDETADLHGAGRLVAQLGTLNGWKRTIELQPEQPFRGEALVAHGVLDLAAVQALIERLERQTGLERQQYVLAFVPEVRVEGALAGQALRDDFAPRLEFRIDELQLQLLRDGSDTHDPLKPVKAGLLKRTRVEPNTIAPLGLDLAVPLARQIALAGLALALAGVGVVGIPILRAMRRDEAARIRLRYGPLIVDAAGRSQPAGERVVELATFNDLAKLAEKHGAMILHEAAGSLHRYLVQDSAGAYLYRVPGAGQPDMPTLVEAPTQSTIAAGTSPPAYEPAPERAPSRFAVSEAARADWQAAFLAALHEHGRVPEACQAVGISVASAYLERERAPAFAQSWATVQASAKRRRHYGVTTI